MLTSRVRRADEAVAARDYLIKELVERGRSTREIERATGINHATILNRLKKDS